jgi:hypothetical protein
MTDVCASTEWLRALRSRKGILPHLLELRPAGRPTNIMMPSRVFILGTGRCGTMSFIHACAHITNWSAGHESNFGRLGPARLEYPERHIEADNRLSWLLGRLWRTCGDDALYVHLKRDAEQVAASHDRRWKNHISIARAYAQDIIVSERRDMAVCMDLVETVTANVDLFMERVQHGIVMHLENIRQDFPRFWQAIGAEGDLDAALREWNTPRNVSP